jgi:hypothetical protein
VQVAIKELIPEECAGLKPAYEKYLRLIAAGKTSDIPPIKVAHIGRHLLVRDGTNRVLAFKERKIATIDAKPLEPRDENEAHYFERLVQHRVAAGMQGFNQMRIATTEEERDALFAPDEEQLRQAYSIWKNVASSVAGKQSSQENQCPKRYPAPKQRDLTDAEKSQLRGRIEQGDADIYALAVEFGCSASQVAGIKAAMRR